MVSLSDGQKAALSGEAVKRLKTIRHLPLADVLSNFLTMPSQVPGLRQSMERNMAPGEADLIAKHGLRHKVINIAGVPVVVIEPPIITADKDKKMLFNVFGGAFVMGSPRDRAALTMAAELGVRVYSPDFTKAPEAKYPLARDQCLAVYRALISGDPPGGTSMDPADIYAMGSSSGAQLLVSMFLVAREEGLPLPAAGVYLCTPAVDLTGAGDSPVFNGHGRDIMPVSLLYGMVTQNYLAEGINLRDPLVSPMYAEYDESFPRTVITVGTRDFALSNGVRFFWKLREAGVEVELLVSDGMWHGFIWEPLLPEAMCARAAVVKFLVNNA